MLNIDDRILGTFIKSLDQYKSKKIVLCGEDVYDFIKDKRTADYRFTISGYLPSDCVMLFSITHPFANYAAPMDLIVDGYLYIKELTLKFRYYGAEKDGRVELLDRTNYNPTGIFILDFNSENL